MRIVVVLVGTKINYLQCCGILASGCSLLKFAAFALINILNRRLQIGRI